MSVLNVIVSGKNNTVDYLPYPGSYPEGTQVNVTNPCTGETVTGIFTKQKYCSACVFYYHEQCPRVPNYGCLARAMRGEQGQCALLSVEDLI